jgi:hypothetical protein
LVTILIATLVVVVRSAAYAQDAKPTPSPVTSIFLARTGQNLQAPYTGTYHAIELFQVRGKWIYPDVGYVDCATNTYREFFMGGGRTLASGKKATLVGEGYFIQDAGPDAKNARYLWANPILDVLFAPKLAWETSYFTYIPLNHSAYFQQMIERSKLEYAIARSVTAGGGYSAYEKPGDSWKNQPFGTVTFKTRAGSMEFWIQRMPQGAQVQARYLFTHTAAER